MNAGTSLRRFPARGAVAAVKVYRALLSPFLPPACRFQPSCSEFAQEAFEAHGFFSATRLAASRLLRCHPFHPGGWDPVPSPRRRSA